MRLPEQWVVRYFNDLITLLVVNHLVESDQFLHIFCRSDDSRSAKGKSDKRAARRGRWVPPVVSRCDNAVSGPLWPFHKSLVSIRGTRIRSIGGQPAIEQ
jgi:hypothetical protein